MDASRYCQGQPRRPIIPSPTGASTEGQSHNVRQLPSEPCKTLGKGVGIVSDITWTRKSVRDPAPFVQAVELRPADWCCRSSTMSFRPATPYS